MDNLLQREIIVGRSPGPKLLITGGVHGDEFEPMAAVRRLSSHFKQSPPDHGSVVLVPVVNESAFRRGSRTGDDGLDLARTCPGRPDGSITEQIAFTLSDEIRAADFYIDLHTGGTRLKVMPLVGYTMHPTESVLSVQRRMALAFGLPIVWGTDPNLPGRSLSVARDANVPAIYAEYLGGGGCDPAGIDAYFNGCLRVMRELGFITSPASDSRNHEPLIVEDVRPQSGHMQIQHPSPIEGFFEPLVQLGQSVDVGDRIGTITDILGTTSVEIIAERRGIVIVLHTFARVEVGTGVAVVLETGGRP